MKMLRTAALTALLANHAIADEYIGNYSTNKNNPN
jgi:hypothetical protein